MKRILIVAIICGVTSPVFAEVEIVQLFCSGFRSIGSVTDNTRNYFPTPAGVKIAIDGSWLEWRNNSEIYKLERKPHPYRKSWAKDLWLYNEGYNKEPGYIAFNRHDMKLNVIMEGNGKMLNCFPLKNPFK